MAIFPLHVKQVIFYLIVVSCNGWKLFETFLICLNYFQKSNVQFVRPQNYWYFSNDLGLQYVYIDTWYWGADVWYVPFVPFIDLARMCWKFICVYTTWGLFYIVIEFIQDPCWNMYSFFCETCHYMSFKPLVVP